MPKKYSSGSSKSIKSPAKGAKGVASQSDAKLSTQYAGYPDSRPSNDDRVQSAK